MPPLFLGPDSMQEVDGAEYYGMDLYNKVPDSPRQLKGSAYWVSDRLFSEMVEAVLKQLRRRMDKESSTSTWTGWNRY